MLLSFPLAYLFNQMCMDFGGMGVLNLMALFIILGALLASNADWLTLLYALGIA